MVVDPNDGDGVYIFYRSEPGDVTVWRYSDDRGVTWGAEHAFSNLHATTTIPAFTEMSYTFPAVDAAGNVWIAYGMEDGDDSDVFVRLWAMATA